MELLWRFLLGGLIVTVFASIADVVRPKTFAGLFGAAPSVALATLSLTLWLRGKDYAALEARSMIAGAIAFLAYALLCTFLMAKRDVKVAATTFAGLALWAIGAFGLWEVFLR
jgi:uncharacterized membrane protein (GlpM family)